MAASLESKLEFNVTDGEGHAIIISTTYNDKTYSCVVTNFIECQKPKPFMYEDNVIKAIKRCDCKFYNPIERQVVIGKETITLKIPILFDDYIEFVLKEELQTTEDLLMTKIAKLEKRIAELEEKNLLCGLMGNRGMSHTTTHTHIYPKWKTIEEFEKLPGFKYFEAYKNYSPLYHYIKIKGVDYKYSGESYGLKYTLPANKDKMTSTNKIRIWYKNLDPKDRELEIIKERYKDRRESHMYLFSKSAEVYMHKDSELVSDWIIEYMKQYMIGWFIVNQQEVVFRNRVILIIVKPDQITLKIMYTTNQFTYDYCIRKELEICEGTPLDEHVIDLSEEDKARWIVFYNTVICY